MLDVIFIAVRSSIQLCWYRFKLIPWQCLVSPVTSRNGSLQKAEQGCLDRGTYSTHKKS